MSKNTLAIAMAASGFTPTGLAQALKGIGEQVAEAEVTRMNGIIKPLCNMALTDARAFLKDAVKSTKPTEKDKPDHVVEQRAVECRKILGAVKLIPGFKLDGMGWWKAYAAADRALKEHNIKPDGSPIKTDEEKAREALAEQEGKYFKEARAAGKKLDEADLQRIAERAAKDVAEHAVNATAQRILNQGRDFANKVVARLSDLLVETAGNEVQPIAEPIPQAAATTQVIPQAQAPTKQGKGKRSK